MAHSRCPTALVVLAALLGGHTATAAESSAPAKVAGLYVQTAPNLYVELPLALRTAAHRNAPGTLIAEVHFATPLADGRRATLALVDDAQSVDIGDVVNIALIRSRGGKLATAPLRRIDAVRFIEAKFHTEMAQAFGAIPVATQRKRPTPSREIAPPSTPDRSPPAPAGSAKILVAGLSGNHR